MVFNCRPPKIGARGVICRKQRKSTFDFYNIATLNCICYNAVRQNDKIVSMWNDTKNPSADTLGFFYSHFGMAGFNAIG